MCKGCRWEDVGWFRGATEGEGSRECDDTEEVGMARVRAGAIGASWIG